MSSPTRNRPHKGRVSPRAIKTWKDAFNGFVHSAPDDSNLQTENLPPPTEKSVFPQLEVHQAGLVSKVEIRLDCNTHRRMTDGQIATQPVNRPAAIQKIAGEKFDPVDIGSGLIP